MTTCPRPSTFGLLTSGMISGVETDPVTFALEGVHPNPARANDLHVTLALPRGTPAELELLDVGGRRVLVRDVGALGAGRHRADLSESGSVMPGIYWLRS